MIGFGILANYNRKKLARCPVWTASPILGLESQVDQTFQKRIAINNLIGVK
jgi:hypothetical protein